MPALMMAPNAIKKKSISYNQHALCTGIWSMPDPAVFFRNHFLPSDTEQFTPPHQESYPSD